VLSEASEALCVVVVQNGAVLVLAQSFITLSVCMKIVFGPRLGLI